MAPLLAIVTFVAVALIALSTWVLAGGGREQEVVRRRLDAVRKAEVRGNVSLGLKLVRDEMLSDVPVLHRMLLQWSWSTQLREFIGQAGMKIKPGQLLVGSLAAAVAAGIVFYGLYGSLLFALAAAVLAAAIPFLVISIKRQRRIHAFEKHFPEALDLLARAVRAGHAFNTGLEMIGKELAEPVAGEFRTTFDEQNFGLPLRDALLNFSERVPLIDVRFFVTALLIQKETGGNLAEILDNLARVIRERFRIYGEVRVRTAQGRLTAMILMGLPPMMIVLLGVANPSYIRPLFDDPVGPWLLAAAFTLQAVGSALLWKIVHIKV
jgi:tight adherence protein B